MAFIRRVIGQILDDLEVTEEVGLSTATGWREPGARRWMAVAVASVRGRGCGTERRLRRPDATDAGTDPRPLELYTHESRGRRVADAACRARGGSVTGDGHPVAPASGGACAGPLPGPTAPIAIRGAGDRGRALGEAGTDEASQGLSGVGATHVAFTLADARDQILAKTASVVVARSAAAAKA